MTPRMRILSAGAPKAGVAASAEAFRDASGRAFEVRFATAPVILAEVESGCAEADVVIAPVATMDAFAQSAITLPGVGTVIGSIAAGVVVAQGAPQPDLTSVESFTEAILRAGEVVYNKASSGRYIAELMEQLGVAERIADKTTLMETGNAVIEYLIRHAAPDALGFGQVTEIRRLEGQGAKLVGPLPKEIGKVTTYAASVLATAHHPATAKAYVRFLATRQAKAIMLDAGIT